jgi:GntR family transcriptional regulator / MocR family aminotransferase
MRALYGERRAALLDAADRGPLAGLVGFRSSDAGMHLVGTASSRADDVEISSRLAEVEIEVAPVSRLAIEPAGKGGLLFGYAAFSPRSIRRAAERTARVLERLPR